MKLKIQKANLTKVILLLLLLTSSTDFSYSFVTQIAEEDGQEQLAETVFNEQHQNLRDGSLPLILNIQPFVVKFTGKVDTFKSSSNAEAKRTTAYIRSCRDIDPSLAGTAIIYPFHFFL